MLTKIGNVVLSETKIEKFKTFSFYLMIVGLFMFIIFPLLGNRIFITEKQLKYSEILHNQMKNEDFLRSLEKFEKINLNEFVKNNYEINSQRGERNKFIMINSIYDEFNISNLFLIVYILNHFSLKENFRWLTKDLQFNFIKKEDFYQNPENYLNKLNENKIKGQLIDSIINFDFTNLDFDSMEYLLLKINGASSENVDMDYYKTFIDNFLRTYREEEIRTVGFYFSSNIKFYLKNIFYNIGSLIEGLFPKDKSNEIVYNDDSIYFMENIFENYLLTDEKINLNHILISKGINSILIKGDKDNRNSKEAQKQIKILNSNFNTRKLKKSFEFAQAIERIIKNLSKNEIENFRGDFNYILTSSHSFVGVTFFIIIPVLCVLRIFYEVLHKIYQTEFKMHIPEENFNASKVVAYSIISFTMQILLYLHIEQIQKFLEFSEYSTFYHILLLNFIISFFFIRLIEMNKNEEIFCDNFIRFIMALFCFNFFFINYGLGLVLTVTLMPLEVWINYINEKLNKDLPQLLAIGFLIICILMDRKIVENILNNYTRHHNNVYPILSFVFIYFFFRINLTIRRRLNLKDRIIIKTSNSENIIE